MIAKIAFGGVEENIVTREDFPLERAQAVLSDEIVAVLGYGIQAPAQAFNLRDNGINIILGLDPTRDQWLKALNDGWEPGKNLFSFEEATQKSTIQQFLVSDAGRVQVWPKIRPHLKKGDALYFSHGFGIVYADQTGIHAPEDIDVILVAPKGSGTSVRANFLSGTGINSSYAVYQDYTGRAEERSLALGIAIGSGYLFPTTFENEVVSDLTGERGVLMGALAGVMEAQYNTLRAHGHSPSEAFNETVEELTQSLIGLVAQNGMDWMFANCSTTAQRGALDWAPRFREAVTPVFEDLYQSVISGEEAKITLKANSKPDYREKLTEELSKMRESEFWQAGAAVRSLRPENW